MGRKMNIKKIFSIFTLVVIIFATACTNKEEKHNVSYTNEKPKEETKIVDTNGAEKTKLKSKFWSR